MQYTASFGAFLAAVLALSEAAVALPPGFRQTAPVKAGPPSKRGASVQQVRNAGYQGQFSRHGALAREKVYLKYNAALPDELTTAVRRVRTAFGGGGGARTAVGGGGGAGARPNVAARATGSAVTAPEAYDVEYLTPVQIGSPPQTLHLDIDTGSADLWVYSADTPDMETGGQDEYNPHTSRTAAKKPGLTWRIRYGDGSHSQGEVYGDTVAVGGLAVENMAVETATEVSAEFTADADIDGLLGLGFSRLNAVSPSPQKTFFDRAQAQLDAFVFTADLRAGAPGTYHFGFVDESLYTGPLTYTAVDPAQGYWAFNASGFQIGGAAFHATTITGIADTGTTLLMLPPAIVDAYYAQMPGAAYDHTNGGYVFPCATTPPDFTLGIEAAGRIVIPGRFLNYSPIDAAATTCYGGLQDDSDIGFAIFGDVALKAAFVVFEGGDAPRLGWAAKDL